VSEAPAHYDLIIIGGGSGDMLLRTEVSRLRTAIVESDRFGGTCLNRGCIPSKMFVVTADAARGIAEAARLGVHGHVDQVDWPAIRERIFGRIDPLHTQAIASRRNDGVTVISGHAQFVGPREIEVGERRLTADQIVIATGSRPHVPSIPGLSTVPFFTSDSIMRIPELPRSMVIIGGGFIAAELGHVFEAFGTRVSIVQQGARLLMAEDEDVSAAFTAIARKRFHVHLQTEVRSVASVPQGIGVSLDGPDGSAVLNADVLLVATGRRPQTDQLGVEAAGLALDEHGHVATDQHYRTSVPGVWAFGDAANHFQLKHLANAEMRVVAHNLLHPESVRPLPSRVVPHAVFTEPQIASVGVTQAQADDQGLDYVVATKPFSDTAYGWAMEDTTSFVKVLADRDTRQLLGAHVIGPQAALLLQPLIQAMMLDTTVDQLAHEVMYIHPALAEAVEQALLEL
jgi:mycothione reductase